MSGSDPASFDDYRLIVERCRDVSIDCEMHPGGYWGGTVDRQNRPAVHVTARTARKGGGIKTLAFHYSNFSPSKG